MVKKISISKLADMLDGRVIGNSDKRGYIRGTCPIDGYIKGKISFIKNVKYGDILAQLQDAVILIPEDLTVLCDKYPQNTYIIVRDVKSSIMRLQELFYAEQFTIMEEGICQTAIIAPTAKIGRGSYVGENVFVGNKVVIGKGVRILHNTCIFDNVVIGNGTYIYSNVCIYKNCQIGNDCLIHSGARIGADGFRFEHDIANKIVRKMYHCGEVMIG